ncbi:hypothetical protein [Bradyrhizobium sp. AUGA SZCCT0160]|uniref:hypothetical protein n=1 Tax=Bradyrhizobium sp. AUGA SZCCT0160 TaxID=2807662 RepID=UPI001BA4D3F3|nr:hypothetical protein [Bradyrhizobium sp. AUGA SZCCT0160]MBR1187268.1 hypothetical protein [Bradyrhizobium sp. AUGA SZCCT0160]
MTGTAWDGTTGKWIKTCSAGTVGNIGIATGIAVDTAIIAGVTGSARARTTGRSVKACGAATATNIAIATRIAVDTVIEAIGTIEAGIVRIETMTIEATMKIGLGGASRSVSNTTTATNTAAIGKAADLTPVLSNELLRIAAGEFCCCSS